jgi:hypothetical protein
MPATIHIKTRVQSGGRVEVLAPGMPEGSEVEVALTPVESKQERRLSALEIIESAPPQQLFKSAKEVDEYLKAERDSWER